MQNDNVAQRLKVLVDRLGMNNSSFADICGIPRATLSQMLTGRNKKISDHILSLIHSAFPQVSILWLLFGEGELFNESIVAGDSSDSESSDSVKKIDNKENCLDFFIDENIESSSPISDINEDLILKGVTNPLNERQTSKQQPLNDYEKTLEILNEIEKNSKKQRKVTHVTIFYDDSTFETFHPH